MQIANGKPTKSQTTRDQMTKTNGGAMSLALPMVHVYVWLQERLELWLDHTTAGKCWYWCWWNFGLLAFALTFDKTTTTTTTTTTTSPNLVCASPRRYFLKLLIVGCNNADGDCHLRFRSTPASPHLRTTHPRNHKHILKVKSQKQK